MYASQQAIFKSAGRGLSVAAWMPLVLTRSDVSRERETRSQNYTRMYSFDRGADCVVCTADAVYIFEFKLSGNGSAEDALTQIKKKEYAAKYLTDGKKIVLIGAGFDEKTRTIKDWKVELLIF